MSDFVHPRPQLVRGSWEDLCGEWLFAYDDLDQGMRHAWPERLEPFDRTIVVPYPPESELSGVQDTAFHPVLWYRREVVLPTMASGQRLLLHFGAVDYRSSVWANGVLVGEHSGGHTPFSCDLTAIVDSGADTVVVVVRAEDQPRDVGQPRGKQDWEEEPHGIWYHRTSGIWQPVWLEVVPGTYITELQWTPDVPGARVGCEVRLNRDPGHAAAVRVVLRNGEQVLADQTVVASEQLTTFDIALPALRHPNGSRLLWRPGSPQLVDAQVRLLEDSTPVDEVGSYLGLRSVGVEDGHFLLNGKDVYLRSVLAQGYWPQSHLAAPDASALRREVELIKELGFNSVRIHQKVEDPRFLYWCDHYGLLVWGEMANALTFGTQTMERMTREWLEVLRRDRSHPCIVTWVPHNESWGIDNIATDLAQRSYATALYHLTKAIDPTRPVISNDGWEHTESDIWTVHDYAPRGRALARRYGSRHVVAQLVARGRVQQRKLVLGDPVDRGQPVMLTEFGGVRFSVTGGADGWGYSQVRSAEALVERLRELMGAVLASSALSGFCYTQLTDTEQEQNGLLTETREPKAPIAHIRKIVTGPRGSQSAAVREGRESPVWVRWSRAVRRSRRRQ